MTESGRLRRRVVSGSVVFAQALVVLTALEHLAPDARRAPVLAVLAIALALPLAWRALAGPRSEPPLAHLVHACFALAALACLWSLAETAWVPPVLWLLGLATGPRGEVEPGRALALVCAPLAFAIFSLWLRPSAWMLGALPFAAWSTLFGALLVRGQAVASRAWSRRGSERADGLADVDDTRGVRLRLRHSLVYGLGVLLLALLTAAGFERVRRGIAPEPERPDPVADARPEEVDAARAPGRRRSRGEHYSNQLSFDSISRSAVTDELMFVARPRAIDGRATSTAPRPADLYLVGSALDYFSEETLSLPSTVETTRLDDRGDGRRDGWIALEDAEPARTAGLELEFVASLLTERGSQVVLAPRGVRALSLPRLTLGEDYYVTTSPPVTSYALTYEPRAGEEARLRSQDAAVMPARYRQVPPPSEALTRIAALGAELRRGTGSDHEFVRRVNDYIRLEFEYDLEATGFGGTAAIADFLERRSGFCTSAAAAMVLLLRTQDVPARVVTGYHLTEWSEEEGAWIARNRHAHAWVEVPFEEAGWVRFDPTPPRGGRGGGFAASAALESLRSELDRWLAGSAGGSLARVLEALVLLPVEALRANPSLFWLLGAAVLGLLAWWRGRGAPSADDVDSMFPLAPAGSPVSGPQSELARALAALGHRRPRGRTPRAFARDVVRRDPRCTGLPAVVESFYALRFGGIEWGEIEWRHFRALIDRLRSALVEGTGNANSIEHEASGLVER